MCVCMCVCICIYIYVCVCVYIYIYMNRYTYLPLLHLVDERGGVAGGLTPQVLHHLVWCGFSSEFSLGFSLGLSLGFSGPTPQGLHHFNALGRQQRTYCLLHSLLESLLHLKGRAGNSG